VIKLDVEGMEPQVLAGARRILDHDRPEVFAEAFTAVEREALERALRPYGYRNAGKVSGTGQPVFRFTAPHRPVSDSSACGTCGAGSRRRSAGRRGACVTGRREAGVPPRRPRSARRSAPSTEAPTKGAPPC
jgi:hypothetical protein